MELGLLACVGTHLPHGLWPPAGQEGARGRSFLVMPPQTIPEDTRPPSPASQDPPSGPWQTLALLYLGPRLGGPQPCPLLEPAHSLGDDRVVEQGVPALLNFSKGEAAAELHPQVDGRQVIGLQEARLVYSSLCTGKKPSPGSHRVLLSYYGGWELGGMGEESPSPVVGVGG